MQEIIQLIRRKSQLLYDINCVRRYIESGEFDSNLKDAWDQFNTEFKEVSSKLEQLREPQISELEDRKMELLDKIRYHEEELSKYNQQLSDVDDLIFKINR